MLNGARLATAVVILLLVPNLTYAHSKSTLHDTMRRLWSDHVAYTRLFIVNAASGSADKEATTQRLLQNQADIGDAVAEFYGRDAGNQLTALLKDHILIAASIVTAAKAGDDAKVTSENARWRANATDIAKFLHAANPWVFIEDCMNWAPSAYEINMIGEATVHELTHIWQGGHCASSAPAYTEFNSTNKCTMSDGDLMRSCNGATCPEFFDGVSKFHYESDGNSEYFRLRAWPDPFPLYLYPGTY